MANVRLNIYENYSVLNRMTAANVAISGGSLRMQGVVIPGSISFNNVVVFMTASGTTAKTLTISFGLYSLNGSTLSLANSASQTTAPAANQGSWITLVTSATQDITPGNWYLGFIMSTSSNNNMSLLINHNTNNDIMITAGTAGGIFVRGNYSVTTTAFPASIATSDMSKEPSGLAASSSPMAYPYILISA